MKQLVVCDWRDRGDFYDPSLSYEYFLAVQETIVRQRLNQECGDTLILTTHPPTITLGRRSLREQLTHVRAIPLSITTAPTATSDQDLLTSAASYLRHFYDIDLIKTNRGGSVWYHDHGVLQLYLIMEVHPFGINDIVYPLEEVLLRTLNTIGIPATRAGESVRRADKSFLGVWVNEKKIAAIGMRVQSNGVRFASMFGASLNVNPNQSTSNVVDPCGIPHCRTTSIARELTSHYTIHNTLLTSTLCKHISDVFHVTITYAA